MEREGRGRKGDGGREREGRKGGRTEGERISA